MAHKSAHDSASTAISASFYPEASAANVLKVAIAAKLLGAMKSEASPAPAAAGPGTHTPSTENIQLIAAEDPKTTPYGIPNTVFLTVSGTNTVIFGANDVIRFLLSKVLVGLLSPIEDAIQNSLIDLEEHHFLNPDSTFSSLLGTLNTSLTLHSGSLFKSQSLLTLADIVYWANLHTSLDSNGIAAFKKDYPLVVTWYERILSDLSVQHAVHDFNATYKSYIKEKKVKEVPLPPKLNMKPGLEADANPRPNRVPIEGKRNILITSALPYVNNVPHLGNIIGSVLSADVYARYCRLQDHNILYICGTDEYGTATETKALAENLSCQEICDKYNKLHTATYDWFEIAFDYFGRTTTAKQTEICQDIFLKLYQNQLLIEKQVAQLFCVKDDRFLADRFVEGTCPDCKYPDARGDQCDKCGHLINSIELIEPRCKICGEHPEIRNSNHLFLDLPKLQTACETFVDMSYYLGNWTQNGYTITQNWLRQGLQDRCITRDLKWGVPVPLKGFESKVFYVWFDAPIGYISITANYTDEWEKWWKNPSQVELYQFMGKDNVPFHTVIFPCALIGTNDNYTLLRHVNTTEYLNYEDGKFSKSRGVGVFGNNVMDSGVPSSLWRYYLLSIRPEAHDSQFSWNDFQLRINSELLANLGNLVNRTLKFLKTKFRGELSQVSLTVDDNTFMKEISDCLQDYVNNMENINIREGLRIAMAISQRGNEYLASQKVTNALFESDPVRCGTILNVAVNLIYYLATLLFPFMPTTSQHILTQLHAPMRKLSNPISFSLDLLPGHCIGEPAHLFSRIEDDKIETLRKMYGGPQVTVK